MQDSGDRHYHLYLGTSKGCVVDVTFSVTPSTTEVNMEVELLVQGHGGEITFRKIIVVKLVQQFN